uniref:Uncharacterized protein n=1 Tax=Dromaius novaehollandiae TaxID=8790 RepID=A0A8C4J9T6_DRONO
MLQKNKPVWSSPGGQNPSAKSFPGPSTSWRALTSGSISHAHLAEASQGSWWSPTGKSRRRGRNLRYSSLVQTGNEALMLCAGGAGCPKPKGLPVRLRFGCTMQSWGGPKGSIWDGEGNRKCIKVPVAWVLVVVSFLWLRE